MKAYFMSEKTYWETPQELFKELNDEFEFTLDPCATHENAKCSHHFTIQEDGLKQNWGGERCFVNPPYGRTETAKWVSKAFYESKKPNTLVVMLLPARTDTKWFHDYIYKNAEIRFLKGRVKFKINNQGENPAPFPSMIVIFKNQEEKRNEKQRIL